MDYSKILDFFKQPRLVLGVALSCGIVLFLPPSILQKSGLVSLRNNYLPFIGFAFILTTVYCVIHVSNLGVNWWLEKKRRREVTRLRQEHLAKLTEKEKEILWHFIKHGTKTQRLDMDSGVVNGLVKHAIIFPASNSARTEWYGSVYYRDHNIATWAWDYLNEHKELLGTTSNPESK